ncbi:MAG: transcription termination/antitermination protein NusA [Candidatus Nealsonbacteria bacterium CG_4_9_14_3_um_filter_35_11]|nr:MAG: transcription termination/antitermination protein NusA [Candidatus Nealsonbacteria bacterium CG_4_9_14_3_um_filter_35_11]
MDLKSFAVAVSQIAEEKGLSQGKVLETIEQALAAAYKKEYGQKGQLIRAKLDSKTGQASFWQVKLVVDDSMIYSEKEIEALRERKKETTQPQQQDMQDMQDMKLRFNPEKHIILEEAKKIKKKIKPGEELNFPLKEKEDFGRIAAQTAKQVILQKIREAERDSILEEYKSKEGEIVSGIIQRVEPGSVYLDLGKSLGVLPREEQVRGEFYRPGQRLKVYVLKVEQTPKGALIFLSRAYPKLISKLFELEVPELSTAQVQIKSIAREPGSRTKIAVSSTAEGVDPIGAMVGQRGVRVSAVISELGGEKIDIVEYSEQSEKYIANSLSPAKVLEVKILPKNTALAIVPNDQISLAIGRNGQNVRLAAKLTGWKIDVKSPEQLEEAKKTLEQKEKEKEPEKEGKKRKVKKTKDEKRKAKKLIPKKLKS